MKVVQYYNNVKVSELSNFNLDKIIDSGQCFRWNKLGNKFYEGVIGDKLLRIQKLSDEELKAKTNEFKERYNKGESLDSMLVEAFAVCREAAKRVLGLYPFHCQIIGGLVLNDGNVAEMRTGEGKTLTATMPVYLNALSGKGVHVVTVNEYLAQRDSKRNGPSWELAE